MVGRKGKPGQGDADAVALPEAFQTWLETVRAEAVKAVPERRDPFIGFRTAR